MNSVIRWTMRGMHLSRLRVWTRRCSIAMAQVVCHHHNMGICSISNMDIYNSRDTEDTLLNNIERCGSSNTEDIHHSMLVSTIQVLSIHIMVKCILHSSRDIIILLHLSTHHSMQHCHHNTNHLNRTRRGQVYHHHPQQDLYHLQHLLQRMTIISTSSTWALSITHRINSINNRCCHHRSWHHHQSLSSKYNNSSIHFLHHLRLHSSSNNNQMELLKVLHRFRHHLNNLRHHQLWQRYTPLRRHRNSRQVQSLIPTQRRENSLRLRMTHQINVISSAQGMSLIAM
mmetsp:Transcript_1759/g.6216  ORF Transcript_1759/g.6216 Transcript_1759/m.6216 type:complete len:285 (+) Transcript_1759:2021-2875(+)